MAKLRVEFTTEERQKLEEVRQKSGLTWHALILGAINIFLKASNEPLLPETTEKLVVTIQEDDDITELLDKIKERISNGEYKGDNWLMKPLVKTDSFVLVIPIECPNCKTPTFSAIRDTEADPYFRCVVCNTKNIQARWIETYRFNPISERIILHGKKSKSHWNSKKRRKEKIVYSVPEFCTSCGGSLKQAIGYLSCVSCPSCKDEIPISKTQNIPHGHMRIVPITSDSAGLEIELFKDEGTDTFQELVK